MAVRTNWTAGDIVMPDDMNAIGIMLGKITASTQPLTWIEPVFLNGWVADTSADSPQSLKYAKDLLGIVYLKGAAIYNGGGVGSGKFITVMPIGYRIGHNQYAIPFYGNTPMPMRCIFRTNGELTPYTVEPPIGSAVKFDIVYKAEA